MKNNAIRVDLARSVAELLITATENYSPDELANAVFDVQRINQRLKHEGYALNGLPGLSGASPEDV